MEKYLSKEKQDQIMKCRTFDEILDVKYGLIGTPIRDDWELRAEAFVKEALEEDKREQELIALAERFKTDRLASGLTYEEVAEKTGFKKTYISRFERGKVDMPYTSLLKLFRGLGIQFSLF